MVCTKLKHALSKKWQRVTESRYTITFVILSIIQAVIMVFLQIRILSRNADLYVDKIIPEEKRCTTGFVAFMLLILENVMLVIFNIYQLYFCLNAIFHQNVMQIFTLVIINVGHVILGIVQIVEVKVIVNKIESECGLNLGYDVISYEMPYILVLATIAILKAGLSWKLYQQFGWNIYKKIGGDIEMQRRLKTNLIFVMLLKINLLFVIIYNTLISPMLIYVTIEFNMSIEKKILCYTCVLILFLVFVFQALAYKSMEKEWKAGMIIFIIFWIFTIADFVWLTYNLCIAALIPYGLYSWIILMGIFIFCSVLTLVYAILVTRNLGKGLKQYYSKKQKQQHEGSNVLDDDIITDDDEEKAQALQHIDNKKKRFIID